ncbi:MAG: enoyl-[acyl-carrier-protein] reductase FabL [Caldilineae bacterium]|nr:enoyl-[acyl-carrier-protein] reductase FabL [Chloroflexota bacterium]MCB9176689.1 enoyl-[acyl-carrier-protein] reductase FabL [Caldilineae bacterium]
MRFENKVALVTGSSRGIGRAIALRLAAEGADVVVNYVRSREPAEATAAEIEALGRRAVIVKANVGEPDEIKRLAAEAAEAFGGVDILVNNAASGYIRPVMGQRVKGWDWTMDINARAALFLTQAVVPQMRERGGGRIVNISSLGSERVMPEYVVIGASKAALEAVTRYVAAELAPEGIICNAVSGGVVETDALKHFERGDLMLSMGRDKTPAGRIITPEDLAGVVAFLCSADASMIVGEVIKVDGGYSIVV